MKTISFGGTYSSYSASDPGQDLGNSNFYHDFIKADLFRSAKIVSWQIKEQQLGKNTKPYTVYIIDVITTDIEYRVERRYTNFRQLYKKMTNSNQKSSYFPKMSLFSSGVDEAVVSQRFRALNRKNCVNVEFISEICKEQKEQDMITFFEFIELRATYERQGISLPNSDAIKGSVEDQLAELMTRLSFEYQEAINILNEIQKKLLESRMKISGELIKIAYQGLGKRPGLLEICTHASNQMVCWRVLEIILKLTSFEHNRQAEMYCKGLANCSHKLLLIDQCLLEHSKVKLNYFKILDIYFKRNNEINMEDLIEVFFYGKSETIREFNLWLNTQQKSSIVVERLDERSPDRRSEIIEKLKQIIRKDDSEWKALKSVQKSGWKVSLQKYTPSIYRIVAQCDKPMQELKSKFISSAPWIRSTKPEENGGINKVQITISSNSTQTFLFEQKITFQKTYYEKILKPPIYLNNAMSFFEITLCHDKKLEIYYNLSVSKKVKEIWNENTLYYLCQLISKET